MNYQANSDPIQARKDNEQIVREFAHLLSSPAWKHIQAHLDADLSTAYNKLQAATSGDEALRASTAYTVMKNLRDLPESFIRNAQFVLDNTKL